MVKHETIDQLKAKLKDAWLRGKEQRIEIGTLLIQLRNQAEHGEWGIWLAELGIPASTASDYMIEANRQFYESRSFEPQPDAESNEMEHPVEAATALVKDQSPSDEPPPPIPIVRPARGKPQLEMHNRIKGPVLYCTAMQKEAYQESKKENNGRVYQIFYAALLEVIGEQQEEVADETLAA